MTSSLPRNPRRFAVLPLVKRTAADRPAVRRYIIVAATAPPAPDGPAR